MAIAIVAVVVVSTVLVGGLFMLKASRDRRAAEEARGQGLAYFQKNDFVNAAPLLTRGARYFPKDLELQMDLGVARYNLKDYAGALQAYQAALAARPNYAIAYNNMGNLYRDMGHTDRALASYRLAIAADSRLITAYVGLATVYNRRGDINGEVAAWADAVRAAPGNVSLQLLYADALERGGNRAAALHQYKAVLGLDPTNAHALRALKRLQAR